MSDAFTSAGSTLYIGAALPATFDAAGYAAVAWTEVGEITDLGEFGREYSAVKHNPLKTRGTVKRKGNYDDGALTLQMARVPGDAGQAAMIIALDSDNSYPIKVTLQDATNLFTTAQVMSYKTNIGSGDQITAASTSLEIDRPIVEV
jgi:hypothetical protein